MKTRLILGIIMMITFEILVILGAQSSYGLEREPGVPSSIAMSGDNTYFAWWTNKTGNNEVMFRASTDGGATFADKINLSNSTDAESQDVGIAAQGDNVIITWWERNATSNEPVFRRSTDNGQTFGPLLRLSVNGTIGEATTEE